MGDDEFSRIPAPAGGRLTWLVEDLHRTAEQLQQALTTAAAGVYEVVSPDKLVRVTVNGRCRLTALELSPYVLRVDSDTLDMVLSQTVNEALRQARAGVQQALLNALPPSLSPMIERTADDTQRRDGQ